MTNESFFKLFIFLIVLTGLIGSIIIKGYIARSRKDDSDEKADRLNEWLLQQICLQCDVTRDQLDQKTRNRIHGVAKKALSPLQEHDRVQIQLPKLLRDQKGEMKNFSLEVTLNHVKHLFE